MKTKSTLLLCLVLIIAVISKAQINKGASALGGNIHFATGSSKDDNGFKKNSTDISVSPSFMKFYSQNHAFGVNLNFGYLKNTYFGQKVNSYGAGVFLRQYKSLGKNFYVFAQEALNFDYSKTLYKVDSTNFVQVDNRTYQASFTVNPGIACDLCKNFQLELLFLNDLLSVDYSYTDARSTGIKNNNFSIGSNLDISQISSLNIGAKIFFGR
jgi:hypothetical protein